MAYPVGHSLVALAIAKKTDVHPLLAIILANISDIDYFFGLFTSGDMNALHHTIYTHSPLFAIGVTFAAWLWTRLRKKTFGFRQLLGIFLIISSHLILDFYSRLPYHLEVGGGTHGFWDFMFAFVINPDFIYNNLLDLAVYGTLYIVVVRFIFKEKKLFSMPGRRASGA